MNERYRKAVLLAAGLLLVAVAAGAQQVWSGYDIEFTKPGFADWELADNQDRITDNVWITRKSSQGIFNIAQEDAYQSDLSPVDTEWAYGLAVDWETLEFAPWEIWHGGDTPSMIDEAAVLHLISDDVYLDIRFTEFLNGGAGAGFTYERAAGPTPVEGSTWGAVKALY